MAGPFDRLIVTVTRQPMVLSAGFGQSELVCRSHCRVFVMIVPVVCAVWTVSDPGLLATHDAVPLGHAFTPVTCGGSVSAMVHTVPLGICPAGGTVTVPLTATATDTGVI